MSSGRQLWRSAVCNYERDIRTPNDQQIERIAEALDVSASSIRDIGVSGGMTRLMYSSRFVTLHSNASL